MATESELIDLLDSIGDRAPTVKHTLERLAIHNDPPAPGHRHWLPISAAVAAVAASVVVSVAIRGDGPDHGAAARAAAVTPTVDHATYPMPLASYYASATQERTLQRAQFVLAQRCAQQRGVSVPTAHFAAGDPRVTFLAEVANNVRPLTLQQARTFGYGMYPPGNSAVETAESGLSPRQLETFEGWYRGLKIAKPTSRFLLRGGCYGQAERALLQGAEPAAGPGDSVSSGGPGLFDDDSTVISVYGTEARVGEAASQVQLAQERWSACMATNGYPGLSTTENLIENRTGLKSGGEKREAVQDVRCKQSTGFMTGWVASMTSAEKAVIAAHSTELAGFRHRLATRMANAAKALR